MVLVTQDQFGVEQGLSLNVTLVKPNQDVLHQARPLRLAGGARGLAVLLLTRA